jgi:YD repeat-containing protein
MPSSRRLSASLPLLTALLLAAPLAAQLPGGGGPDEDEPFVTFSPMSGTFSGASVLVTVTFADFVSLDVGTRTITLNGVDVTGQMTHTAPVQNAMGLVESTSTGTLTLTQGTNALAASMRDTSNNLGTGSASYQYQPSWRGAAVVTPDGTASSVTAGGTRTVSFTVLNDSDAAGSFVLSARCRDEGTGAPVSVCTPSATTLALGAGASQAVTVSFAAGAADQVVQVQLDAQPQAGGGSGDAGWRMVTVRGTGSVQRAPVVAVVDLNSAAQVERSQCVTVGVGPGAAYECGDLRIGHALPAHRTRGRTWSPVLLYNSQHAAPRPTVYADVTLPADGTAPETVRAVVTVNGVDHVRTFAGAGWQPGTTRRIAVQWDVGTMQTGLYAYTLQVTNQYSTANLASDTVPGELAVVNRSGSAFGAGWWLAGWEQLHFAGERILWVGGDGSTRVYDFVGNHRSAAQALTRPDTLYHVWWNNEVQYQRRLPGGTTVWFDGAGRHYRTVNALGQETHFDQDSLLRRVRPPGTGSAGAGPQWEFSYSTAGALTQVSATVPSGPTRAVVLGRGPYNRVTSITDPDGKQVRFSHAGTAGLQGRIIDRYGRDSTRVRFAYSAAGKLGWAETYMDGTAPANLRTSFQSAEARGVAWRADSTFSSVGVAEAYTRIDGPRSDVLDHTYLWLGRWGAPVRVRDAAGGETRVVRGDVRFPALATEMVGPTGVRTKAAYDSLGLMVADTVFDPLGDGRHSVRKYTWDAKWRRPTSVASFEVANGVETPVAAPSQTAYDAVTGNALWQQQGDVSRRVSFRYYTSGAAAGQLRAVQSPQVAAGTAVDSLWYDAAGNLAGTRSPLGFLTVVDRDALGRVTDTYSPLHADSSGTETQVRAKGVRQRVWYDAMDRDTLTQSVGPAVRVAWSNEPVGTTTLTTVPQEMVTVRTVRDAEGRPLRVERWATPDTARVGVLATVYEYDRAGRVLERNRVRG